MHFGGLTNTESENMILGITNAVSLEQQWHKPYIHLLRILYSECSLNLFFKLNNKDN